MSNRFLRKHRLTKTADFSSVFNKKGPRIKGDGFLILFCYNNFSYPRLGVVAAKKRIKKAVARNRFKRIVRETFRLNQHQLKAVDLVVMANKEVLPKNGKVLAKNLENRLSELMQ